MMIRNIGQVNKMLESVNNELNAGELAKVMDKFEQVRADCSKILSENRVSLVILGFRRARCEGESDR